MQWVGPNKDIFYLRTNFIGSLDNIPIAHKLFSILQDDLAPRRPKSAIIDLRLNNGGDFFNTVLFTEALPKLIAPTGKIFLLVDGGTFSAALVTAAMIKGNAPDRTLIVGDTMGDNSRFWAEGGIFKLPNSQMEIMYSGALDDWANGCTGEIDCYWPVTAFGAKIETLKPNVHVVPTFAEYSKGRDPVFETALSLAR